MSIKKVSASMAGDAAVLDKKYFSVDEANRALPYLVRIVDDVMETYGRIVELRQEIESPATPTNEVAGLEREYEQRMDRLSELVDELHLLGVELKDFERGLIDFPAMHDGREVLLCWQHGEEKVEHWHEADAGFSARQPAKMLQ